MHKAIMAYLADLLPLCNTKGMQLSDERAMEYGVQLIFVKAQHSIILNVYFSEKKGISTVIGSKKDNPMRAVLESCLGGKPAAPVPIGMHAWDSWIGSDECGKGDYFGPLVVGSFYLERKDLPRLLQIGVCDSKTLNNPQIIRIAKQIYSEFNANSECLILKPPKYNDLYANFASQKKNLNDMLAWAHGKNIGSLITKYPAANGVIIDQFSPSKKASQAVKKAFPEMNIIERPGGEADTAVAAASILARYQLLQSFDYMNNSYKMKFQMGASHGVIGIAREFAAKYGFDKLGEVAKLHFKTTAAVEQRVIRT